MLKVSRILFASGDLYGWLLPSGEFHQVPEYGHARFAMAHLDYKGGNDGSVYAVAFDAGWIRIMGIGAEARVWNTAYLHRLQDLLLSKGISGGDATYYLDGTSVIKTTLDDLLAANNINSLAGERRVASVSDVITGASMLKVSKILKAYDQDKMDKYSISGQHFVELAKELAAKHPDWSYEKCEQVAFKSIRAHRYSSLKQGGAIKELVTVVQLAFEGELEITSEELVPIVSKHMDVPSEKAWTMIKYLEDSGMLAYSPTDQVFTLAEEMKWEDE
jgi:hypothetical protein